MPERNLDQKLLKFDGSNYRAWKTQAEVLPEAYTWKEETTRCKMLISLGSHIDRLPKVVWRSKGEDHPASTPEEIIEAMDKIFERKDMLLELFERRLKRDESPGEYCEEMIQLCAKVNPEMTEEEIMLRYIGGLPNKFQDKAKQWMHIEGMDTMKLNKIMKPKILKDRTNKNKKETEKTNKPSGLRCDFCSKPGHKKDDCYSNPESEKYKNSKN